MYTVYFIESEGEYFYAPTQEEAEKTAKALEAIGLKVTNFFSDYVSEEVTPEEHLKKILSK